MSGVRTDILSAINELSNNPNLLDRARQEYPILKNHDIGFVDSPNRGAGFLESWAPGEPGGTELPRPKELPLNMFGVENYRPDTRPIDVLGDVVSHHLINVDPTIKQTYGDFVSSLEPWQKEKMQQQYQQAQKDYGENRPYEDWEQSSGLPAYFRGYPFQQWEKPEEMYTPQQMQKLDGMMKYLKGGNGS